MLDFCPNAPVAYFFLFFEFNNYCINLKAQMAIILKIIEAVMNSEPANNNLAAIKKVVLNMLTSA